VRRLRTRIPGWSGLLAAWGVGLLVVGCPASDGVDDLLVSGKKLYSQYDEELIIRHFFRDRRGGFFVDVGAYHWKDASTTYYLEKHLGWSGIAVDALEQFRQGYEKHRPGTRFFNYIVTDQSGALGTLYLAGPLSSTQKDHVAHLHEILQDVESPDHPSKSRVEAVRQAWEDASERSGGLKLPSEPPELNEIQVETITLTELLDRNGVPKIDFLSMDIEQGEPAALAGFDIERFRPELVCVEASKPVQQALEEYFSSHGYERIEEYDAHDAANWYFKPKDVGGG
jgi:FkbM family methyltransferase